eukprot:COSAG01_NODE_29955_length_626_cov_1.085389_2_plen_142_part_01
MVAAHPVYAGASPPCTHTSEPRPPPPPPPPQFKLICQGNLEFPDPEWTNISVEAKDLVSHMLVVEPAERYGARECLGHPWLLSQTWEEAATPISPSGSVISWMEEEQPRQPQFAEAAARQQLQPAPVDSSYNPPPVLRGGAR